MSFSDSAVPSGYRNQIAFIPTQNGACGFQFNSSDIIGETSGSINRIKPSTTYTLSFWLKSFAHAGMTLNLDRLIWCGDSNSPTIDSQRCKVPAIPSDWEKYVIVFKTPATVSEFRLRFILLDCSTKDKSIDLYISSLKLEEGTIATDWTPSTDDIDQSVKAQISMCVQKDKDNNLVSEINIASNKLTINTDNFTLAKDGTMTCTGATIKGGTLTSSGGTDNSARLTIAAGTIRRYFDNELLCYYHASTPKSQNRYECLEYTNGLEIVKKQNTLTDIYYSALFDDDGFSLRSNHRASEPMSISISATTDWSYGSISAALRSIIEAKSALIISANEGRNALILEGNIVWLCGQLEALNDVKISGQLEALNGVKLRTAIGTSSSQSYVYVVADKKTGEISYLSA